MSMGGAELAALGSMMSSYALPISAGLQLAGTFANNRASKTRQNAVNNARSAEMMRQQEYGRRSMAAVDNVMPQFTREAQDQGQKANEARLTERLMPTRQFNEAEFVGSNADPETKSALAKVITDTIQRGRDEAGRQARLMSFGAQSQDNALNLGRSGSEVGVASNFSRGSNNALGGELQSAQSKGRGMQTLGSLFNGLGNIGMMYSLTRPLAAPVETRDLSFLGRG
jgi:hypothetical protein